MRKRSGAGRSAGSYDRWHTWHPLVSVAWPPVMAVAVVCAVFLTPDCASACSCGTVAGFSPQEIAREALSGSDAVFAGEVIDIVDEQGPIMRSDAPKTVTFRVSEAWKGAGGETVDVQTAYSEMSCGYPFNEGDSYLVFASKGIFFEEGELEVALCGSTKPLSEVRAALAALGPGTPPTGSPPAEENLPDTSGAFPVLLPSVLVLLSAVGAVAFVLAAVRLAGRRRTRR